MKKFLRGMLCIGVVALACMAGRAYAGEKANVVVTNAPGYEMVMKTLSLTAGQGTPTSGLGTITGMLADITTVSTGSSSMSLRYVISGTNTYVYMTDPVTGATSTANGTGTVLFWGTP